MTPWGARGGALRLIKSTRSVKKLTGLVVSQFVVQSRRVCAAIRLGWTIAPRSYRRHAEIAQNSLDWARPYDRGAIVHHGLRFVHKLEVTEPLIGQLRHYHWDHELTAALCNSASNHAFAYAHCRSAVASETPSTSATLGIVNPAKK